MDKTPPDLHRGKGCITSVNMGFHVFPAIYIDKGSECPSILFNLLLAQQSFKLSFEEIGQRVRYTVEGDGKVAIADVSELSTILQNTALADLGNKLHIKPLISYTLFVTLAKHQEFMQLVAENRGWLLMLTAGETMMIVITHPDGLVRGNQKLQTDKIHFGSDLAHI